MSNNRTLIALAISLSLTATAEEFQEARDAIDSFEQFVNGEDSISATDAAAQQSGATTTTTTTAANGVQLDKAGLPWDERIHSSNKKLTGKGTWWGRKNLDAGFIASVEAELRAALAAGGTVAAVATTTAPATLSAPALGATGPSLGVVGAPVTAPAPSEFEKLVASIAANTLSPANPNGKLSDAWVKSVLDFYVVPNGDIQNLAHMGDAKVLEIRGFIASELAKVGVQF